MEIQDSSRRGTVSPQLEKSQTMQNLEAFQFQEGYVIKRAKLQVQPSVVDYALANVYF